MHVCTHACTCPHACPHACLYTGTEMSASKVGPEAVKAKLDELHEAGVPASDIDDRCTIIIAL